MPLTVGLPVRDGERFVGRAVESLLGQTFERFRLVISDNASTDGTGEICRAAAASDDRVRYHRHDENLGAAANFRWALAQADSEYFKWAAHDDVCEPTFLEHCLRTLDAEPDVVLSHTGAASIDEEGRRLKRFATHPGLDDADPVRRYRAALAIGEEICTFWGVARTAALRSGPPLGSYVGHDRVLLAALALRGRLHHGDEVLFLQREHRGRSVHTHDWRRPRAAISWYDPARAGARVFPTWRLLGEHARVVALAPQGPVVRAGAARALGAWARGQRRALRHDLVVGVEGQGRLGPLVATWLDRSSAAVRAAVPAGATMAFVDQDTLETEVFGGRIVVPFPSRDGTWWGLPADDADAVAELERQRAAGVGHLVVADVSYWWLDHYRGFARHLEATSQLVHADRAFRVYRLDPAVPVADHQPAGGTGPGL
ncbi:MAG: glycosyltransferase family 2 protein [Acidimicrobiia bacterium]|nr:glycosyltransferase family 2 protein [Acidimicrobiia bacterium]